MDLEYRSLSEPPEFRSEGTRIVASGVAMRYGAVSRPVQMARGVATKVPFREVFTAGAFARTITQQDIRSHNEHGGPYLARTGNGSLRLTDDRSALTYELDLPDTTAGRDAAYLLERRDIRGASVGFNAIAKTEKWSVGDDGMALRSVGEARLNLVDLTIVPAYDDSTAELALRSLAVERHMDIRSLMEAAERGELPTLISSPVEDESDEQRSEDDPRPPATVVRARMSHLIF